MYEYQASLLRVVDGDTVELRADLGFDVHLDMKVRLTGINAPEHNTPAGAPSTEHLRLLLSDRLLIAKPLIIRTEKDRTEKYGRYLATLILPDGTDVNARMVADGFAKAWDGKGPRPV